MKEFKAYLDALFGTNLYKGAKEGITILKEYGSFELLFTAHSLTSQIPQLLCSEDLHALRLAFHNLLANGCPTRAEMAAFEYVVETAGIMLQSLNFWTVKSYRYNLDSVKAWDKGGAEYFNDCTEMLAVQLELKAMERLEFLRFAWEHDMLDLVQARLAYGGLEEV